MDSHYNESGAMIVNRVCELGQRIWARLLSLTPDGNPISLHSLVTILAFIGVKLTPQRKMVWQRVWNWGSAEWDDKEFLGGILVVLIFLLISMGLNLLTTSIMFRE